MFKLFRKRKIRNEIFKLFIHYQNTGDWTKAGIYAERYLNFDNKFDKKNIKEKV